MSFQTRGRTRGGTKRSGLLLMLVLAVATASACHRATASLPASPAAEPGVHPGANETFLAEDLDVARFVKMFEGESREISVHRDAIVRALGIAPGATIADVGAGTGLFLPSFEQAVGSDGRVYAVDISPNFLAHLRSRVRDEQLDRVEVVASSAKSVELPAESVDIAFVCDTYHHFEYPRPTLASLRSAIRPGGTLVVVDFDRIPGKTREWLLDHMRAGKEVFIEEISAAGFELIEQVTVAGLEENYMLRFRRP